MTIGFLQILLMIFIIILLFGNFKNFCKDIAKGVNSFKETLKRKNK
jgi:Sec-independent protein translocase protein TatA